MDTSIIIFSGIIVCGLASIPVILKGIHRLVKDFFKYKDKQEAQQHEQKIDSHKDDLKKVLETGTLTDLLDVAKQLGDENKKKEKDK